MLNLILEHLGNNILYMIASCILLFINQKLIRNFNNLTSYPKSLVYFRFNIARFGIFLHEFSHAIMGIMTGLNVKKFSVALIEHPKVDSNTGELLGTQYNFGQTQFTKIHNSANFKDTLLGLAPWFILYPTFGWGYAMSTHNAINLGFGSAHHGIFLYSAINVISGILKYPFYWMQYFTLSHLFLLLFGPFLMITTLLALDLSDSDLNYIRIGKPDLMRHEKLITILFFIFLLCNSLDHTIFSIIFMVTIILLIMFILAYFFSLFTHNANYGLHHISK